MTESVALIVIALMLCLIVGFGIGYFLVGPLIESRTHRRK